MSVQAMAAVFDADLPPTQKLVMLAISDSAGATHICWPSQTTLASKTGLDERTIRRTIASLETDGILERVVEQGHPAFRVLLPGLEALPLPKARKGLSRSKRLELLALLLEAGGPRCSWCGREGTERLDPDRAAWHIDRLVPGKRGGTYALPNCRLSCRHCNLSKRDGENPRGWTESPPPASGGRTESPVGGDAVSVGEDRVSAPSEPSRTITEPIACPQTGCDRGQGHSGPHRDPWWEAIAQATYPGEQIPEQHEKLAGKLAARARRAGHSPERILAAAAWIHDHWGADRLTLPSLVQNYERASGELASNAEQVRRRLGEALRAGKKPMVVSHVHVWQPLAKNERVETCVVSGCYEKRDRPIGGNDD